MNLQMKNTPLMNALLNSLSIASFYHKDQKRKGSGGSPYINHLIEVAYLLTDIAKVDDITVLQAAVLHDILEDTLLDESQLRDEFSEKVVGLVLTLTDDKNLSLEQRRQLQIEHIKSASWETKVIKLADHCSNIASIPDSWDTERVISYLNWSEQVATLCFEASAPLEAEYKQRLVIAKDKC